MNLNAEEALRELGRAFAADMQIRAMLVGQAGEIVWIIETVVGQRVKGSGADLDDAILDAHESAIKDAHALVREAIAHPDRYDDRPKRELARLLMLRDRLLEELAA